jgi:hypothetical protein
MFNGLRGEAKAILKSCVQLCWYMRGSIQYHDILEMSPAEREIVKDFVEEHMDAIKKHPYPVY